MKVKKILIIEDNLQILDNTKEHLELEGYTVLTAKNGIEGIEIAINNTPDLILCDIMMPLKNGYEVLTELKAIENTSRIPFIFVTASAEKSEVAAGLNHGAFDYISKPFDYDHLIALIKKTIN